MYTVHICVKKTFLPFFQATIGIDFLSKTMYLEDRTVSPSGKHLKFEYEIGFEKYFSILVFLLHIITTHTLLIP